MEVILLPWNGGDPLRGWLWVSLRAEVLGAVFVLAVPGLGSGDGSGDRL